MHSKVFDNGSGEFAWVRLRLNPLDAAGTVLVSYEQAEVLTDEYIAGIEEGIDEAAHNGVLNGGRVIDVGVTLLEVRYHEIDSNRRSFRIAAAAAFQKAMRDASPVLVSPSDS